MNQKIDTINLLLLIIILYILFLKIPARAFNYSTTPTKYFTTEIIYQKEISEPITPPPLGDLFYVVNGKNEDFYLPTAKGFNIYSSEASLVKKVETDYSKYRNNSNILIADSKIIYISKKFPGYVNVFSLTGSELDHIQIVAEKDKPYNLNLFDLSNISLSKNGEFIFFTSSNPARVYRFGVKNKDLAFYDTSKTMGTWFQEPLVVDENKVLFTTYKGILQLFDQDNISSYVFAKGFNSENSFLNHISSASKVPTAYNSNNYFTLYQKYLCSYEKSSGSNTSCVQFTNPDNKENIVTTNSFASENGVYFLLSNNSSGSKKTLLTNYTNSLERVWQTEAQNSDKGGIYYDGNTVVTTGDTVSTINSNTGDVLGSFAIANTAQGVKRVSLPSPTVQGNYYVFAQVSDYQKNTTYSKILKFKGINSKEKSCELGFYCDSEPKHNPVILIHGLGGNYQSWFDSKNTLVRESIINEFKKDDSEFPDHWVHAYSYGYSFGGDYNYQGKIEDISTNLHFDIDRLAYEHKKAGGEGKVDLIGYSLGGLVARHYILEKSGFPGVANNSPDTKVGKLILVASPVNGSSGLQLFKDLESKYPVLGKDIFDVVNLTLTSMQGHSIDLRKDIGNQINTGSTYLELARNYKHNNQVDYYRSYSNFVLSPVIYLFGTEVSSFIELGDLTVLPNDTILPIQFSDSSKIERVHKIGLNVVSGVVKLQLDKIDILDMYHAAFISSNQNISNLVKFLTYE